MTIIRLLADDLTGALDTSAAFVGLCGPLTVTWDERALVAPPPLGESRVWDIGTREASISTAIAAASTFAPYLVGATIAYKKIDSLLRGNWAAELGACIRAGAWQHCVVAPAFPDQGRRTVRSRQEALGETGWFPTADPILPTLRAIGLNPEPARPGVSLAPGVQVFDAENDSDLRAIAASGRTATGPILWCGAGGLARALADGHPTAEDACLATPVLGLFGSDQPQTAAQLSVCRDLHVGFKPGSEAPSELARRLAERQVLLLSLDLPTDTSRGEAAHRIGEVFGKLVSRLPRPGTLLVAGGETLKAVCIALGAKAIRVTGQVSPGLPRSMLIGGRWDGVAVISKSGAFGPPGLWGDLLAGNGLLPASPTDRVDR